MRNGLNPVMLEVLERKLNDLDGPIVAANVGPPDADKIVNGKRACKLVVVTSRELAGSYFPLGFKMVASDLAVAYMILNEKEAQALDRLRGLGNVLIISKAEKNGDFYSFKGVMMAYETVIVGDLSWHVLRGIYPPFMEGREYLYKLPKALGVVEAVASGGGLSLMGRKLYPIQVTKKTEVSKPPKKVKVERFEIPRILLLPAILARWRAERVSGKKASSKGETSEEE